MRFVETPVFTAALQRHLDDERQLSLMLRPEHCPVIPGAGGLRKVRWAASGTGKRGGLRVIYFWAAAERAFYRLFIYAKSDQGDLTPRQARQLGRLVREEFR